MAGMLPAWFITLSPDGANTIQGNYIGTDSMGSLTRSNRQGIVIVNSAGNQIGGTNAAARNVVSGNRDGVLLLNSGAGGNLIQGNYVGLNAAGTLPLPNSENGIVLNALFGTADYASGNMIGGSSPGARNVISGNGAAGIQVAAFEPGTVIGPTLNRIIGNYIGTDATGLLPVPNFGPGIYVTNATQNIIGGSSASERNVISGNIDDGIQMWGARSNIIDGNWIGPDASGLTNLGNLFGVAIYEGSYNIVGGFFKGNVISGNDLDGIQIGQGGQGNKVIHNVIGADENVQIRLPNFRHGVAIFDSTNNTIGGESFESNWIVHNHSNGVFIGRGDLNSVSVSNVVRGNTLAENGRDGVELSGGANFNRIVGNIVGAGPGVLGKQLKGNSRHGIGVFDSTNNVIGGVAVNQRNYVFGNASNGVFLGIGSLGSGSVSNSLQGNRIGTTPVGNGGAGVFVQGDWNIIGGTNAGEGNVIAYNGSALKKRGHGVVIAMTMASSPFQTLWHTTRMDRMESFSIWSWTKPICHGIRGRITQAIPCCCSTC